jgi:OTU domain-containing protein 3
LRSDEEAFQLLAHSSLRCAQGNPENYAVFRRRICEHMASHRDSFEPFFMGEDERVQSFDDYLNNMRKNGTWGGNLELQAASMALQVNIVVHQLEQPRWEVVNWREPNARFIQLSYHTGDHYASVQPIGGAANVPPVYVHSQRASASSASASASAFAQSAMASAAQNNSEVHDALGALAFVDDDANWQEHLVMRTTECTLEEARHALLDNFQDTDAAINFIMTLKLSSLDVDVPKAVNSRQKLTESGGVLSIPTPDDDLVASHATSVSVRNLTPPPPPSSSSSSSSSTADASTSAQSPRAAPPPAMSAEEAAIASARAAMAQGWQTKQGRKKKPKSKEELLAKVQAKAPQQHTSNRERKQKGAEQPDGAAPPPDVPPPDVVAQLAGIVPEQELRPVVDLGALAI